ncbi:MAG: M56 family metallopeptidase [Acidobacteriaceae bacterium]
MRALEFWAFAYLLNSLWQVPLLYAAGWLAARVLRPMGAAAEHRVWVAALMLQSLLPAASIFPWKWPAALSLWHAGAAARGDVYVLTGSGSGAGVLPFPALGLAAIVILYAALTAYFAARFLWRTAMLPVMQHEAAAVALSGEPALFWARCSKRFAIEDVSLAASSRIFGPVTLGMRHKVLLLPVTMIDTLSEQDLCTVIAHEFAHMHRQDFTKNLVYELLSLPVMYHPLLWLTRSRITESREMACDQAAAAFTGQTEYAHSLLHLASLLVAETSYRTPHTIGIFDANAFERRVMNLMEKHPEVQGTRRVAVVVVCAALTLATCASAVTLGMHVNAFQSAAGNGTSKAPKELSISSDVMQGNLLTKAVPVYPPAAKKAKIQGTVVLEAVISKDGNVERLRVLSGPAELQQSALDAVRQWKYKPYLLNGDPVQVKTKVNIVYDLKG